MRRLAFLMVVSLLALGACNKTPPRPKLEWDPKDGRAKAGWTLELRATKPLTHQKEDFTFSWSMEGDCAGKLDDPTNWKISYVVPKDCPGGTLTFKVVSTTKYGSAEDTASFKLTAVKEKNVGLKPVRYETMPANWTMIHDFEGEIPEDVKARSNNLGAHFGTWKFKEGVCDISKATDGGSGILKLAYNLPYPRLSSCGYFEYFKGGAGEAQPYDLNGYLKFGFIAKATGDEPAYLRIELVEFDKYANFNQGIVSESDPIKIDGEWRRHEVLLKPLAATWNLGTTKSIGFRIDSKDGNGSEGTVLLDNLVLVKMQ